MKAFSLAFSPFAAVVFAFYVLWFLLTICNQFNYETNLLARLNALLIIPRWTFFAPHPGKHDYHLLYRVQSEDGLMGTFHEVPICNPHRDVSAALWNHRKRIPKMIFDVTQSLMATIYAFQKKKYDSALLRITFQYLLLLHIVSTYCQEGTGQNVQFVLIRTEGHISQQEPVLVFASEFHCLTASCSC